MGHKEYVFEKRKAKVNYTSLDYSKEVYAFLINDGELIRDINYRDNVIYVSLSTENRLDDYTPYPSPALNKRFADFGGKGEEYLEFLKNQFLPLFLVDFPVKTKNIIYGGISLGGLHAVYTSYLKNPFEKFFGIVSSLWYPGFLEFIKNNSPFNRETCYFLLNGEKEGSKHKGLPLEFAYDKAKEASSILKAKAKYVSFISDQYAHHDQMSQRFETIQEAVFNYINKQQK